MNASEQLRCRVFGMRWQCFRWICQLMSGVFLCSRLECEGIYEPCITADIRPTNSVLSTNSNWIIIINVLGGQRIRVCHRRICFTYNGVVLLRDSPFKRSFLCKSVRPLELRAPWQTDEWKYGCSMALKPTTEYQWGRKLQEVRNVGIAAGRSGRLPPLTSEITMIANKPDWLTVDSRTMQEWTSFRNADVTARANLTLIGWSLGFFHYVPPWNNNVGTLCTFNKLPPPSRPFALRGLIRQSILDNYSASTNSVHSGGSSANYFSIIYC